MNQWTGIADELQYTRAGFLAQKFANPFADSIKQVLTKGHGIKNEQTAFWEKETETQAEVAACNFVLDELAQDVFEAKIRTLREVNPGFVLLCYSRFDIRYSLFLLRFLRFLSNNNHGNILTN